MQRWYRFKNWKKQWSDIFNRVRWIGLGGSFLKRSFVPLFFLSIICVTPSLKAEALTEKTVTAYIITEINAYRSSLKLKPVQVSDETCDFAKIRAAEIVSNFSHDEFNRRVKMGRLPYKHWTVITENIAMTSDYKEVEKLWEHSPGHAKNMRADTPYVCVIRHGKYFAYLGMKP